MVVGEGDVGPVGEGAFDAGTDAVVGKQALGHEGGQDGVADIGVAGADLLYRQMVRKVSRADDFDAIAENKGPDRRFRINFSIFSFRQKEHPAIICPF